MVDCSGNTFNIGVIVSGLLPKYERGAAGQWGRQPHRLHQRHRHQLQHANCQRLVLCGHGSDATGGWHDLHLGDKQHGAVTSANINIAVTCGRHNRCGRVTYLRFDQRRGGFVLGVKRFGHLANGMTTQLHTQCRFRGCQRRGFDRCWIRTTCALTNAVGRLVLGYNSPVNSAMAP